MYEFIYREAAGVYWNKELRCFQSQIVTDWSYKDWYKQIVSVVRSGLGVRLTLSPDTEFCSEYPSLASEILSAEAEVQTWIDENLEQFR